MPWKETMCPVCFVNDVTGLYPKHFTPRGVKKSSVSIKQMDF